DVGPKSGRMVIDAQGISKAYDGRVLLRPFDIRMNRGDRVALVGPNGVGKTTLLNMLIGQEQPDTGTVRTGTNVALAVFDQARSQLDPNASLWDSLTQDPEMRISGQSDQVMVRGAPRHVVGYLKEFLFDEAQARAPVRSLSGGERARLLLARIMARQSNLLVLDEPTNDLDVETLDLLQDLIGQYDGTVLLVSHDRDFLDRVAVTTVAMEGDETATIYAGGWSDYRSQRPESMQVEKKEKARDAKRRSKASKQDTGLSFTEKHRLKALPDEIARLEAEIGKLTELLADPELFTREPVKFRKATEAMSARQDKLMSAEEEWLELAEKAEGAGA
ncbi:MAG: ATP-binding cassette domain-containing protein, partial [Paracoccaceae bacterium]